MNARAAKMNAGRADRFRVSPQHFKREFSKPAQPIVRIFC
jgi:hypothetical protein